MNLLQSGALDGRESSGQRIPYFFKKASRVGFLGDPIFRIIFCINNESDDFDRINGTHVRKYKQSSFTNSWRGALSNYCTIAWIIMLIGKDIVMRLKVMRLKIDSGS